MNRPSNPSSRFSITKLPVKYWWLIALLWSACSTERNTFVTRTYHNLTCHYNGYFWGNLAFNEGYQKLIQNHQDDFSDLLPVFVYAQDKEAQSIYTEMDRAIKKATAMIENHTITTKQKREIPDAVKYIKYCYILLAKARLYKNEDLSAIEALDYATKEYRRTSIKYLAFMWEARAYNKMAEVSESQELIDLLKSAKDIDKKTYAQVCATIADYCSLTGEYDEMQKWLLKAVASEHKKKVKSRYYYILGQLAAKAGDKQKAFKYYSTVLKMHPPYDLEFEAHISRALIYVGNPKENALIKKELTKMLKPTINIDNRDQIYYALGQIAEKERDTTQGVQYFNKSIRSSTTNTTQKAISYLSLANVYFISTDYPRSKKYYDSTLRTLPKKFKGRDSIVDKRDNLNRLVQCLDMIALDDSLLKLANLSPAELNRVADTLIARERAAKLAKKLKEKEAEEAEKNEANSPSNSNQAMGGSNSSWYFYNPGQIQLGLTEFLQKWGNRPLEDDWRRSKKVVSAQQNVATSESQTKNGTNPADGKSAIKKDSLNDNQNRAYYLKNVPKTEAQKNALNDSLVEAYYNAGSIYKEYLRNYPRAAGEFEGLLQHYPENKYKLVTYYSLYRTYEKTGNTDRMNYYKNLLLTQYPNTEYAMLISNPEKYRENQKASQAEMLNLYSSALQNYQQGNFANVLNDCRKADTLYPKNPYAPKFAYLEAAGIGYSQGLDAYKNALTKVMLLYPRDSVKLLAQATLALLNKKGVAPPPKPVLDTSIKYTLAKDSMYYFIVLADIKDASKVVKLRVDISEMNDKTYSEDKLKVESLMLDNDHQMVKVGSFTTPVRTKDYYGYASGNATLFKSFDPGSYQTFYISDKNFRIMLQHGKSNEYLQFFNDKLK